MHVDIDDLRLEVERWDGDGGKMPPIVLLHEGLGSVSMWRDFPQALARATQTDVVAYSRAGYGRSSMVTTPFGVDYMHREAESALPRLLDRLGIARPILFGHSDGASIALLFAARYPERVAALVLEAPHVFVEDVTVESIAKISAGYPRDARLRESLGRHHADAGAAFSRWSSIWLDPAFRTWNITTALKQIAAPVLVIQGRDDEYGTFDQVDAIAGAISATDALLLGNCRHSPHRDARDAVLARTSCFVGSA